MGKTNNTAIFFISTLQPHFEERNNKPFSKYPLIAGATARYVNLLCRANSADLLYIIFRACRLLPAFFILGAALRMSPRPACISNNTGTPRRDYRTIGVCALGGGNDAGISGSRTVLRRRSRMGPGQQDPGDRKPEEGGENPTCPFRKCSPWEN